MNGPTKLSLLLVGVVLVFAAEIGAQGPRFSRTEPVVDQPIVEDGWTDLVWQGCVAGLGGSGCVSGAIENKTWQQALSYCEALDWGGFNDWRLPNNKELFSIVDQRYLDPCVDGTSFPSTPNVDHWSSTTWINDMTTAYRVRFSYGLLFPSAKADEIAVRCVRDLP